MTPDLEIETHDNLEWLGLDSIPTNLYNPLLDFPIGKLPENPLEDIIKTMRRPEYISFACKLILNFEIMPFQSLILDRFWHKRLPMLIMSRGGSKTSLLAVYSLLKMIFDPGCKIVLVGAAFRQSKQIHEYMCNIWDNAPILRDIAGRGRKVGPRRETDRCEFTIGNSLCIAIPIGTGEKIRGLRANYIMADEFDSIHEEIFNLVIQGFGVVASDPLSKVKQAATIKKMQAQGLWTPEMESIYYSQLTGNQIVYSGTAGYEFKHFYKYFRKWHTIITSKGDPEKLKYIIDQSEAVAKGFDWRDYCIMRVPYTHVPEGLLDPGILAQAKATLTTGQFLAEYCATFIKDSDGFFKRSILESATTNKPIKVSSGKLVQFSAVKYGDEKRSYVMGIDPAADRDNAAISIVEIRKDHRRIVHVWTTNKTRYNEYKKYMRKIGMKMDDDYYRYIAKKIRSLMRAFQIEHIIMDKHGGGGGIAEALASKDTYEPNEHPLYEIIDPDKPKMNDIEEGLHILQLLAPTTEINSDANHGMLKDLQDKVLLFPLFDSIEMEKSRQLDEINDIHFDTYEDLIEDMEELKNEMTTIVMTATSILGQEHFDTPEIKLAHNKKGRLRKDRYSALLYANYYARTKDKDIITFIKYKAVGGTKKTMKKTEKDEGSMYTGLGLAKMQNQGWAKKGNPRFIKHKP